MVLNPYELNGTQFLLFYSVALIVIFLLIWPWRPRASGKPRVNPERLHLEHWAVLAGGLSRAAEASFTRSLQDGVIFWNEGERRYEPTHADSSDPLAQLLKNKAKLSYVLETLEKSCAGFEKDLQHWGLLQTQDDLSRQHFKITLGYGFLLLLAIVRMIQGLMQDRAIGFLVILMMLDLFLGFAAIKRCRKQTREGLDLLQDFSARHDPIRRAPPESELPLAVALGGAGVLNGSVYGHFMWAVQPERKILESTGDGGYSVMDAGSSCDSGDGGGSGCGGGGGGD